MKKTIYTKGLLLLLLLGQWWTIQAVEYDDNKEDEQLTIPLKQMELTEVEIAYNLNPKPLIHRAFASAKYSQYKPLMVSEYSDKEDDYRDDEKKEEPATGSHNQYNSYDPTPMSTPFQSSPLTLLSSDKVEEVSPDAVQAPLQSIQLPPPISQTINNRIREQSTSPSATAIMREAQKLEDLLMQPHLIAWQGWVEMARYKERPKETYCIISTAGMLYAVGERPNYHKKINKIIHTIDLSHYAFVISENANKSHSFVAAKENPARTTPTSHNAFTFGVSVRDHTVTHKFKIRLLK